MKITYTRKMSFNERLFVVADRLHPPIANRFVFEGAGAPDPGRLRSAVAIASDANPGSRLVLRGYLAASRWVDSGAAPPVIEVPGGAWTDDGLEDSPFLQKPLPPREGPTCDVLLVRGAPTRIVFRTHHGVMDGRGTLTWAEDVFRALRGEPSFGSGSRLTDTDLARSFQKEHRRPYPTEQLAPTGRAAGNEAGIAWRRVSLRGSFHNLLPRLAVQVAQEAWRNAGGREGKVLIGIPVDMRPRVPGLVSTGNLTMAIYVPIARDTTPEQVADEIRLQLREKAEGRLTPSDDLARYLPMSLLGAAGTRIINRRHRAGIYSISGMISNMGRINLNAFSGGGFEAGALWAIPPLVDYLPFFLGMCGYNDTVELILALPRKLATDGRIDAVMDRLVSSLK
jgi:hypothetical protein